MASIAIRLDRAVETGQRMRRTTRAFERSFGSGSATEQNMRQVSSTLKDMASALRDDGSRGFIVNVDRNLDTLAAAPRGTTTILVNPDRERFEYQQILRHAAGHESAHSFGLRDQSYRGYTACKFGDPNEQRSFRDLPSSQRLINPRHLMDFR